MAKTYFRIRERVDQVTIADIHATILAEDTNGRFGKKNKLADFITINDPASGTRAHRWVAGGDEVSQLVLLPEHSVGGFGEDDRANVCDVQVIDP